MSHSAPHRAQPPLPWGYLGLAGVALVSALLVAGLTNFIIDPYGLYPAVGRLSPDKQIDLFYHLRLHKPYAMQRLKARQLVVGSSRAARLPPDRMGSSSYNASLPGVTLREIRRIVEHAQRVAPLEAVLVGLDYYMFREGHAARDDHYRDSRLLRVDPSGLETLQYGYQRLEDYWRSLLSADALLDSWRTLYGSETSQRLFGEDGTWEAALPPKRGPRWFYGMLARQKYAEFNRQTAQLDMTELATLLAFCDRHDIAVTLLVSPLHGLTMNAVQLAGGWDSYLQWQAAVVTTATQSPGTVRVVGLETDSGITQESIENAAPFFQDGVHYTGTGGDRIMSCLYQGCPGDLQLTELDADSIADYLSGVDSLMRNYPRQKPREYALLLKWLGLSPPPAPPPVPPA